MKNFDFDIETMRLVGGQTPGVELQGSLGSQSAKAIGSYNISGIALPVVDKLIDKMIAAGSREELMFTGRALDRVLRAEHIWVPHWSKGQPLGRLLGCLWQTADEAPYDRAIFDTWWYDAEKAKTLRRGN